MSAADPPSTTTNPAQPGTPQAALSALAEGDVAVLRDEIIRHGARSAAFGSKMIVLGGIFVLLTETRTSITFAGLPITNISLVLTVIPPVVGFMLIQAVDSLFIREKHLSVLAMVVRQTKPDLTAAKLAYVLIPYNYPSKEMLANHPRASRSLHYLELFTNAFALLLIGGFLVYAAYALHHRFGATNALADFSILVTAVAGIRAGSALVGIAGG